MEAVCYTSPYGTLCPGTIIQENSMKKLHSALLAAALVAPCALLADYDKEFNVKFTGYAGSTTLTNFPALVRLSAARNAFDYSKCKLAGGADTRFFDADGNLLPSEVDTWNPDGESLVWVSVPELNRDTTITVRYGNAAAPEVTPTDVWTNGYVGVWHMNAAATSQTQSDSTMNPITVDKSRSNNAYMNGTLPGVPGKIGLATHFGLDATLKGGYWGKDTTGKLGGGVSNLTVEAWTYHTNVSTSSSVYQTIIARRSGAGNTSSLRTFRFLIQPTRANIAGYVYPLVDGSSTPTEVVIWPGADVTPELNTWVYQAMRYRGEGATTGAKAWFYDKNKYQVAWNVPQGPLNPLPNSSAEVFIGNWDDQWSGSAFLGLLDEIRVSNVARSDAWLNASHDTVSNPDFAEPVIPNDWTAYAHKFSVAFPGVEEGATLTDFPVLVKVSEAGIPGFRYADCAKEGGADLRFTDGNGTTPLPCEVEVWDTNGVSLVWVKIPTLTKNTRITGYYGWNFAPAVVATDVWDANYIAVWHMDAASDSLSQPDATANNRTVTLPSDYADNVNPGVVGIVGAAADFGHRADGKGNYGRSNADGSFDGLTTATFEFWTKQEVTPTNNNSYVIYCGQANPTVNAYSLYQQKGGSTAGAYYNEAGTYIWGGSAKTPLNEWNHHAFRYDGINGKTSYIQNNVSKYDEPKPDANGHTINAVKKQFCIGSFTTYFTDNANYVGLLDEVRISNVARSDAWILATHDTIAENATFTRYGRAGDNVECTVVLFR